tara:strand:- start:31 stop:555 length:525 start_codon:yes stop_codon:yes gene_type:complete
MSPLIDEARLISKHNHRNQSYGIYPYFYHIEMVVNIGIAENFHEEWIIACYLHDIVEDTPVTVNQIKDTFGYEVSRIVSDVTDPSDLFNRKDKKQSVYKKIIKSKGINQYGSLAVKLADRLANVKHSKYSNNRKYLMYKKEHEKFKDVLFTPPEFSNAPDCIYSLWDLLDINLR